MNTERQPILDSLSGWMAGIGHGLRHLFMWPRDEARSRPGTDPDFDGWLVNDPMVTLNAASRYGDDATGFHGGAASENPEPVWKDN